MSKKINLNEILGKSNYKDGRYGKMQVIGAMRKVCELVLQQAAENAVIEVVHPYMDDEPDLIIVNKKSITDTIKQVE